MNQTKQVEQVDRLSIDHRRRKRLIGLHVHVSEVNHERFLLDRDILLAEIHGEPRFRLRYRTGYPAARLR